MNTTTVIVIVVIVVVVIALIGLVAASMRKKNRQDNAARAGQLREEADTRAAAIPETQAEAKVAQAQAEKARLESQRAEERATEASQAAAQQQAAHEDQIRAADRLDPDVDTRAEDYSPQTIRDDSTTAAPATARAGGTEYDADGRPIVDPHHVGPRFDSDGRPIESGEGGSHRA